MVRIFGIFGRVRFGVYGSRCCIWCLRSGSWRCSWVDCVRRCWLGVWFVRRLRCCVGWCVGWSWSCGRSVGLGIGWLVVVVRIVVVWLRSLRR